MSLEKVCTVIQTGCSLLGVIALGFGYYQLTQIDKQLIQVDKQLIQFDQQLRQGDTQIKVSKMQLVSDSTPEISMYLKKQNSNSFVIENLSDNSAYNLKIISYDYAGKKFCIFDKNVSILAKDSKNIDSVFEFYVDINNKSSKQLCVDKDSMESYAFDASLYNYISSKSKILKFFEDEEIKNTKELDDMIVAQVVHKTLPLIEENKRKEILKGLKEEDKRNEILKKMEEEDKTFASERKKFNDNLGAIYILYSDKIGNSYIYSQQFTFDYIKNNITSTYTPTRYSLYSN